MTTQEAYEQIKEFFSQPDAVRGFDENGMGCVYRAGEDRLSPIRCAFGCLIPDEMYHPDIEGLGADEAFRWLQREGIPIDTIMDDVDLGFICAAQVAHDKSETITEFLERLDEIAASKYQLQVNAA